MKRLAKQGLKRLVNRLGYQVQSIPPGVRDAPGSMLRPMGRMREFLEDVEQRGFRPRGVLDVGANEGAWTRMALEIFDDARFLLVEPQEELRPRLEALRADQPNVDFVLAGAGAEAGERVLTLWPDLAGSSFLPDTEPARVDAGSQRSVALVTLDALLAERPGFEPDLVKLDVQGFELEALAGGQSLFGRAELFILEVSTWHFMPGQPLVSEVVRTMAERGYELYDVPGHLRRPLDGALGQLDLAFAREGGLLRADSGWG